MCQVIMFAVHRCFLVGVYIINKSGMACGCNPAMNFYKL